ncbi:MAG: protein serine/threonine phosphatase, partial [Bacteroidetes bacterium]|nr:protein serine/threonine phosphatase [Bacteroidota bacterium]
LGGYFQIKTDYLQAIDYYQKSLKIGEELKDPDAMLVAIGNIGALYILLGQHQKALEYQLKSKAIAEKNNRLDKLASIYNNLCLIYNEFKDYKKGVEYGNKSLEIYKKLNDRNGVCAATGNIGNIYEGQKKYDKALQYFLTCYQISQETENTYEEVKSMMDIGQIYCIKGNYPEAIKFYQKAKDLAKSNEDDANLKSAYFGLYETYKKLGDKAKALENYEAFNKISEQIQNDEKEEAVNKKVMEFEFNKRAVRDSIKNAEEGKIKDLLIYANKAQIEKDQILKVVLTIGLILVIGFGAVIFNRFRITRKQKQIIEIKNKQTEEQKEIIENKNKEILDSINYAKRIQYTLLAHEEILTENMPNHFVLYKPKDIVSGDYYWAVKKDHLFYLACCDSTGHGVPGAFMSLLNIGFLSEAINEKNITGPHEIFNYARERLINSISKEEQKDGFDGILICINQLDKSITYAGANIGPILISDNTLHELPYDKMPVGKGENEKSFTLRKIDYKPADTLYLYTDGYADQFGGPKGKKFKYKQLEDLFLAIDSLSCEDQKMKLETAFMNWKGNLEQIDDVLIMGVKL